MREQKNTIIRNTEDTPLKSLQILRAIASINVVYFHILVFPVFGFFGVDIFFVISGFVMAMIMEKGQSPHTFAINRISRIIPLYWLLTTFLFFILIIKPEILNSTKNILVDYIKSILFIPYFNKNGLLNPILVVGWTLNYEMFFYLCIYISIIIEIKIYIQITISILVLSFIFLGKFSTNSVLQFFFGSSLIFDFILGIISFKIYSAGLMKDCRKSLLLIIALFSYLFMAFNEIIGTSIARFFIYGIPSATLVLSIIGLEQSNFIKNSSYANILASIGDASYATYLSHFFVVLGTKRILFQKLDVVNPYTPLGILFIILTSLVLGQIIFIILDKPLNKYFKKKLNSVFNFLEHKSL